MGQSNLTVRELTLQPLLNAVQNSVSDHVLADAEWQMHVAHLSNSMMLQLRKYVMSERLADDVDVPVLVPLNQRMPRSPWQARKPRWFARAFPRKYTPLTFTVHARVTIPVASYNTFPESTIRYPSDLGRPVRVQVFEDFR